MFKLTLKYIKGYKKNTITNIIGIAFSIMLIFSLVGLSDRVLKSFQDTLINAMAPYDARILDVDRDIVEEIYDKEIAGEQAKLINVDCGMFNCNDIEYCSVFSAKGDWLYINKLEIIEGRVPQNAYEICIEKTYGLKYKVGVNDTLTGELNFNNDGKCDVEFKIVGILESNGAVEDNLYEIFSDYSTAIDLNEKFGMPIDKSDIKLAVAYNSEGYAGEQVFSLQYNLKNKYNITDEQFLVNEEKEQLFQDKGVYTSSAAAFYAICIVVVICMIIFIYNTISIGMTEKIRQYGTLRCIGLDNNKLVKMIMLEELIYSIVGGVIGIIGGKIINNTIADYVISDYITANVNDIDESILPYIITCIVTIVAVLIASMGMLIKMNKLKPIQMIRYAEKNSIHKCKKEYKSLLTDIANRNLKRTPSKTRIMSVTVGIAVLLVVTIGNSMTSIDYDMRKTVSSIADFEVVGNYDNYDMPYVTDEGMNIIKNHEKVEEVYWQRSFVCESAVIDDKLQGERVGFFAYSDNMMEKFLKANDMENLINKEEIAVLFNRTEGKAETVKVVSEEYCEILCEYVIKVDSYLEGISGTMMSSSSYPSMPSLIINEKLAEKLIGKVDTYSTAIIKSDGTLTIEELITLFSEYDYYCIDLDGVEKETSNEYVQIIILAMYMVVSVVVLSIFVISNIIKSNVSLRRKEIGMLRSVGAEKKWIEKLFVTEIMITTLKSTIIGAIISILPSMYMYDMMRENLGIGYGGFVLGIPVIIIGVYLLTRRIVKKSLKAEIADIIRYE